MLETYRNLCWAGTCLFGILALLCTFGGNYYGSKIKQNDKKNDTSNDTIKTGDTYHVSGDIIKGNKTSLNNLEAPNALIATVNQSGGKNIVNYYTNEYRELNSEIRNVIIVNIEKLIAKYPNHPFIILQVEHGNSNGFKVARELGLLFDKYNMGSFAESNVIIGQFPSEPISILTHSTNKMYVNDLINALKPYINAEYNIIIDDRFSVDYLKYHVFGQPNFSMDGRINI